MGRETVEASLAMEMRRGTIVLVVLLCLDEPVYGYNLVEKLALKGVPVEIEEVAYMEGASLWTRYFKVVFPLLKPATVSCVITQGLWIWNDYFFIAGLVIPAQMVIVPVAQVFGRLNIPNSRFTPMIMFITCSLPFSTFLFTGFMKGVPVEANTLYPLLRRLSSQGLLDNRWDTSTSKPRKYYVITEKGKQVRGDLKNQWKKMAEAVDRMM